MGKGKILIVEPDDDIRNMVNIYFTSHGFELMCATDGAEALRLVTLENVPNVMVIEQNLSDIDGRYLWQTLQQTIHTRFIPVIFFTDKRPDDKIRDPDPPWYHDFMEKPFDIEELKLRVQGAINWSKRNG